MTPTTEPLSKVHVINVPGLNVPKLRIDQAVILSCYTGYLMAPIEELIQSLQEHGFKPDPRELANPKVASAYSEQFTQIVPRPSQPTYADLFYKVVDVLRAQMNGPVAMWDKRVDVFLEGHLPPELEETVTTFLRDTLQVWAEFTRRPGITKQTWVTLFRPDPTEESLNFLVRHTGEAIKEKIYPNEAADDRVVLTIPYHLPEKVVDQFCQDLKTYLGFDDEPGIGYNTMAIGRDPKKKRQFVIRLGR